MHIFVHRQFDYFDAQHHGQRDRANKHLSRQINPTLR